VASSSDNAVEFESAPGQDVRPEVARVVVNQGYDLLEMRPIGMSLEEIFLQLTRDEPEPPEMAAESDELPMLDETPTIDVGAEE
jgi:ABC-2 type transport system ATP-binding protein